MEQANTQDAQAAYPVVYRNLMAVGLLGSVYQAHADAEVVNTAVELTLSNPGPYRVYRAIAQGIGGDGAYASATLGKHIEENPDDDGAKVAMAVSLMMAGDPSWKGLIENVLAVSSDQGAREAANNVIAYLQSVPAH